MEAATPMEVEVLPRTGSAAMDLVPTYEHESGGWPEELSNWEQHVRVSLMSAFECALRGDDARKSLLDQIMRGIDLTPIILDPETQRFYTPNGSEFTNFGHPTEALVARVMHVCAEMSGFRVIMLVPDASVSLPWCDLVRIIYRGGELVKISVHEVKCNRQLDSQRLGKHFGKDAILRYTSVGEKLRIPLASCNIELDLILMEEMTRGVFRVGNAEVNTDGLVVRSKTQMKVTEILNSPPMVAYL